jgi:VWFA-related protein
MTQRRPQGWRVGVLLVCMGGTTAGWRDAGTLASQTPTFSSRIDTVRVDVSVRRGDRAVTDLGVEDFEVFDNGVRQRIDLIGRDQTPVNVVLALDVSGSVEGDRLQQLRAAGGRLIDALGPGDTGALVTFTDRVLVRAASTSNLRRLRDALAEPSEAGDTALIDAAHAAMVLGEGESGRPIVIIFSDGADTASFLPSLRFWRPHAGPDRLCTPSRPRGRTARHSWTIWFG